MPSHALLVALFAAHMFACETKPAAAPKVEMVPINDPQAKTRTPSPQFADDEPAAGPRPVEVSAGAGAAPGMPSLGAPASGAAPVNTGSAGPAVSAKDCSDLFDKYLSLAIGADARLTGVPPEMIAQVKAQAIAAKGDPCSGSKVTRKQHQCAMAAKSPEAWQACLE
jgi:hypothetical protein